MARADAIGYDFGYAYPRPYYGSAYGGAGFFSGSDVAIAMPPPVDPGYPPYPLGYGEASYGPTAMG